MAACIGYISINDLMEDNGEYGVSMKRTREEVIGSYCVIKQVNDMPERDKYGKLGGTISCAYKGEVIYERSLDAIGEDGYSLPTFICVEDYKRIKEALDKFWVRRN